MHYKSLFCHLSCPRCLKPWKKTVWKNSTKGTIIFTCDHAYPIINTIPVLVPKLHGSKKQTQLSFGSKWTSQPSWGFSKHTARFMERWILEKYGWKTKSKLTSFLSHKKNILDAGCGTGRDTLKFARLSPHAHVWGVDFSDSVFAAPPAVMKRDNTLIVKADLTMLPFSHGFFDFIYSEGVIHHTPDPYATFTALVNRLAHGGEIALYVYHKKPPVREFTDTYLREKTTQMSDKECWKFSKDLTRLGKIFSAHNKKYRIAQSIPLLHIQPGRYTIQDILYNYFIKSFWNSRFSFKENALINFDWYHPYYAYSFTVHELRRWFQKKR
ncbi:MAG: methyltransferase domain-containing protein, partial [Elusimicrobia bacterium]|nr:methyltransferase domain-containing protein [Elusimicrobiota bacterium]MBD3411715.1 methyltransferase domain-containing protein [Elusimicrobiota bacterium]